MRKRLDVRLPEALDATLRATAAAQDRTVTWVVERALEAALSEAKGPLLGTQAGPGPVPSPEGVRPAASPRVPRPARDVATPEPIGKLVDVATGRGRPSKRELDMQRQLEMNSKRKGSKT
jgi:hypothetical protein